EIHVPLHQARAEVGAEHEECAMRQIRDAHQAENQREAGREQKQQTSEGDAVERLNDPELHRWRACGGLWTSLSDGLSASEHRGSCRAFGVHLIQTSVTY